MKLNYLILLISIIAFGSCRIHLEKKHYSNGFFVSKNTKIIKPKDAINLDKTDESNVKKKIEIDLVQVSQEEFHAEKLESNKSVFSPYLEDETQDKNSTHKSSKADGPKIQVDDRIYVMNRVNQTATVSKGNSKLSISNEEEEGNLGAWATGFFIGLFVAIFSVFIMGILAMTGVSIAGEIAIAVLIGGIISGIISLVLNIINLVKNGAETGSIFSIPALIAGTILSALIALIIAAVIN